MCPVLSLILIFKQLVLSAETVRSRRNEYHPVMVAYGLRFHLKKPVRGQILTYKHQCHFFFTPDVKLRDARTV
jgi:hypothetical protein